MNRARLNQRRVVFPDGTHPKVLRAAQILVDEGICQPVLLGEQWKVHKRAEEHNVNLNGVEIIEIHDDEQLESYAKVLWERRQRKGETKNRIRGFLKTPNAYASMMVAMGDAHGLLGGLANPYADTIRPALKVIGPASGTEVISGVYVMLFKDRRPFFGDCSINTAPDAETLARIAHNTAGLPDSAMSRVAMISTALRRAPLRPGRAEDAGGGRPRPSVARPRRGWGDAGGYRGQP